MPLEFQGEPVAGRSSSSIFTVFLVPRHNRTTRHGSLHEAWYRLENAEYTSAPCTVEGHAGLNKRTYAIETAAVLSRQEPTSCRLPVYLLQNVWWR